MIKIILVRVHLLLAVVLLASCNSTPRLKKFEYLAWIDDSKNEATVIKESENLRIICSYTPSDYLLLKELENELITVEEFESKRKTYTTIFFKLQLTYKDGTSIFNKNRVKDDGEIEQYLRGDISNDLYLLNEKQEKTEPSILHLIRNYELKAETELILGFERKQRKEEITLFFSNTLIDTVEYQFSYQLDKIAQLDI